MIRTLLLAAGLAASLAACSPKSETARPEPAAPAPTAKAAAPSALTPEQQANLAALAGRYRVSIAGDDKHSCDIKLDAEEITKDSSTFRLARIQPTCVANFPALQNVAQWEPRGPGSLALFDKTHAELGDFSPVQDGAGVYLRGGLGGKVFELRQPGQ